MLQVWTLPQRCWRQECRARDIYTAKAEDLKLLFAGVFCFSSYHNLLFSRLRSITCMTASEIDCKSRFSFLIYHIWLFQISTGI